MNSIVKTEDIKKYFPPPQGESKPLKAVDEVNLQVKEGETLGLVGESGCGKTTLGRTILRLLSPTEGTVYFRDNKVEDFDRKELTRKMNIVFQDPATSLNPHMTVSDHLRRPLEIHDISHGDDKIKRIIEILNIMGLKSEHMIRYPHELSGGQKQRVSIARALCVEPEFIVLDEPTSALDVSVQSKILKLLERAKESFHVSYMFISHDINLVRSISNRIAVMYLGRIVEIGGTDDTFNNPYHPYTRALFASVPQPDPNKDVEDPLTGEVPSPVNIPTGCPFAPRCREVLGKICKKERPGGIKKNGRKVNCHIYGEN